VVFFCALNRVEKFVMLELIKSSFLSFSSCFLKGERRGFFVILFIVSFELCFELCFVLDFDFQ